MIYKIYWFCSLFVSQETAYCSTVIIKTAGEKITKREDTHFWILKVISVAEHSSRLNSNFICKTTKLYWTLCKMQGAVLSCVHDHCTPQNNHGTNIHFLTMFSKHQIRGSEMLLAFPCLCRVTESAILKYNFAICVFSFFFTEMIYYIFNSYPIG